MADVFLCLMPREVELVMRPLGGDGINAQLLKTVQGKLNAVNGEIDMTDSELRQVRAAAKHWRGGGERQFKALLEAADRGGY